MPRYSIKEAIEKNLKSFLSYLFAFLAALSINRAITQYIVTPTEIVRAAIIITIVAMVVLVIISLLDPSDVETN